ncbi:hypothetical protein ISS05_00310 [Candidatus Woesearchaeota archaeon]|nr:hypothetical protein [Candidatus Woesearchaeota archaeon]
MNKNYNDKAVDYGNYLLAAVCFSIKELNRLNEIENKPFREINNFFEKEKILQDIKLCEIGGEDILKLRLYGAEVEADNQLINLDNHNKIFNKRFDLTASAYFFSSCNFIKTKEKEIFDPKKQIQNTQEVLSVFSLLTKKGNYSIHKGADLLDNEKIIQFLKNIKFKKISALNDITILEKI